jgi:hypothetical protein
VQAEAGRATRQSGLTVNAQTLTKQGFPAQRRSFCNTRSGAQARCGCTLLTRQGHIKDDRIIQTQNAAVHGFSGCAKKRKVRVFGTSAAVRKVTAAASLVEAWRKARRFGMRHPVRHA